MRRNEDGESDRGGMGRREVKNEEGEEEDGGRREDKLVRDRQYSRRRGENQRRFEIER